MELAFGPMDSSESLEAFYDIVSTDMYTASVASLDMYPEELPEPKPKEVKIGEVRSLAKHCLHVIADFFHILYEKVPHIPNRQWEYFTQILPIDVDLGYAALVVRDGLFWRRVTLLSWPGFHQIENAGNSWKRYALEKYFAEYIEKADINTVDYLEAKRLAEAFAPFIVKLEIKELNVPPWPPVVETSDSTDTNVSTDTINTGMSKMTLYTYMNRHVKYDDPPISTDRIYLGTIFRALNRLEELKICFGYRNYYRYNVMNYALIKKMDALRLASAIEAINNLKKLTITSSLIPPDMLEIIRDSIECHDGLEELELSRLRIGDKIIIDIIDILENLELLKKVSLVENGITSNGISLLVYALMHKNIKIEELDLSFNKLDDVAGSMLAGVILYRDRLKKLYLAGCGLGSESGVNFGIAIQSNTTLEVLDLSGNYFDYEAGESLLRGVENNNTLSMLDVRGCDLPKETVKDILDICFEHNEQHRKKEPVYKYVLPKKKATPPPLVEEEEEMDTEQWILSKCFMGEKDNMTLDNAMSQETVLSGSFSDISDYYAEQRDCMLKAGFTGTFSSGFGPVIEGYVEDTRRRQREEARRPKTIAEPVVPQVDLVKKQQDYFEKRIVPPTEPVETISEEESERPSLALRLSADSFEQQNLIFTGKTRQEQDDFQNAKRVFQLGRRKKKRRSYRERYLEEEEEFEEEEEYIRDPRGTLEMEKRIFKMTDGVFTRTHKDEWGKAPKIEVVKQVDVGLCRDYEDDTMKEDSKEKQLATGKDPRQELKQKQKRTLLQLHKKWENMLKRPDESMPQSGDDLSSLEDVEGLELVDDLCRSETIALGDEKELTTVCEIPFWRPQERKVAEKIKAVQQGLSEEKKQSATVEDETKQQDDTQSPKVIMEKTWQQIYDSVMSSSVGKSDVKDKEDFFIIKNYLDVGTKTYGRDSFETSIVLQQMVANEKEFILTPNTLSAYEKLLRLKEIEAQFIKDFTPPVVEVKEPPFYGYNTELYENMYHEETVVPEEEFASEVENQSAGETITEVTSN
ncbi:uncharacterized protein LOC106670570 [Cimex lectularius]|uniref:Uncharacterized protein n=1 Tax=Cimex lectularius TaxID=79782 RepID=A0A8I6S1V5_CIMLE|nr:uncharacterized protein LOC106670570 [Cimex lectularius]